MFERRVGARDVGRHPGPRLVVADGFQQPVAHRAAGKVPVGLQFQLDQDLAELLVEPLTGDEQRAQPAAPGQGPVAGEQNPILGTGEPEVEQVVRSLEWDFGWKARVIIGYNPELAQRIYAASDLVLVPSRYEPCGLSQMLVMRYVALPVVRETGGLADTVTNYDNAEAEHGTGFMFLFEEPDAVRDKLRWAIDTYRQRRTAFERMQARAMQQDFGWDKPAQQYVTLYRGALAKTTHGQLGVRWESWKLNTRESKPTSASSPNTWSIL